MLNRCLEFKQSARYPNARVLLDDIERYIEKGMVDGLVVGNTCEPDDQDLHLKQRTSEALIEDARVLTESKQFEQAIKLLDGVLAEDPRSLPAMLAKATTLARAGRFDDAIAACRTAQAAYAKEPQVFATFALVYDEQGRPQFAEAMRKQERALREAARSGPYRGRPNAGI
jgi:tetratricopeptide (TPR) repeat protein